MEKNTTPISKEEALKKVAEVLEEALAEYETLEKMDLEMAEDPSRPFAAAPAQAEAPAEDEMDEDEDKDEDEKDEDEKDEDEESEEALKSEFAAIQAKMEKRGFLKSETAKPKEAPKTEVKKSEEAPKAEAAPVTQEAGVENLKKSFDGEIAELKKAIASIAESVSKIAAQPVGTRKGVSGYAPLKKSEESQEQPLRKSTVIDKLLDLKKSGDRRVNTSLINRVETNRMSGSDLEFIKGILG